MRLRHLANSLITRLILVGMILTLLGTGMRYVLLTKFLREDLETVVSAQQLALANYVAGDIDHKIRERRAFLERQAGTLPADRLGQPQALEKWLAAQLELASLFPGGIHILAQDGRTIAALPARAGEEALPTTDIPAAGRTDPAAGTVIVGLAAGRPALALSAPIRDAAGRPQGVLTGLIPLAATPGVLDNLQQGGIGAHGGFRLVSLQDHLYVGASDPALARRPLPAAGADPLVDRLRAGFRGTGVVAAATGGETLAAVVPVPSTGWLLVAELPAAEAFATVERTKSFIVRNSAIIVLVVLMFVALVTWWVLKPLFDLARQADRMTRGDAPLTPLPIIRDDEVGHLTAAFNRLLAKLTNSQEALSRMAHHDSLTGLPNRRLLMDRLRQALARAQRNGTRVALLFLDLDGFKPINDALGHEAGDGALRLFAERLSREIRQEDTFARLGGDEFVLLATDLAGHYGDAVALAESIAAKLVASAAQPMPLQGEECVLGVSIGIAICGGEHTPDQVIRAADQAMYAAKEAGRGCYRVTHPAEAAG